MDARALEVVKVLLGLSKINLCIDKLNIIFLEIKILGNN